MGYSEFCEKEYEIAIDSEFINEFVSKGLQNFYYYIPSQRKEKDIGADFMIQNKRGKYMFLQYKVPYEYEKSNYLIGGKRTFKFRLHKKKYFSQNSLLAKVNKIGALGFYVSPLFSKQSELKNNLFFRTIRRHSKWIKAKDLKPGCGSIVYTSMNSWYHCELTETDGLDYQEVVSLFLKCKSISFEELCRRLEIETSEFYNILNKNNIMVFKLLDEI